MLRLLPMVLSTMVVVAFGWSNARRVPLNFVVGVTETPLIVLLLASFTTGAIAVFIHSMVRDVERRALARKMRTAIRRKDLEQLEDE